VVIARASQGAIEVLWWHATVIAVTLFAAACTIIVASRAFKGILRTRAVVVADRKYDFAKHSTVVCLVVAFWLFLIALVIFASAAVLSDLPSLIREIFQK
jgi:hypothetical protein